MPALTLERFPQSSNGPRGTVSPDFYTQFFFAKLWACAPADGMLSIFEYGFDFAEILVSKVTYNTFSVSVVSMTHRLSLAQRCQKRRSKIFYDTLSLSLTEIASVSWLWLCALYWHFFLVNRLTRVPANIPFTLYYSGAWMQAELFKESPWLEVSLTPLYRYTYSPDQISPRLVSLSLSLLLSLSLSLSLYSVSTLIHYGK